MSIVEGSLALMEAAARAGVQRFVYGSSLLVYSSQPERIDLDTPARPAVDYGRAKLEAEEGLTRLAAEHGVELCNLRLPHVYGARDLMFSRIQRGLLVVPGHGDNLFSHLYVRDAARLLREVTTSGLTGTWPVADDRATTWSEFLATIGEYYPRLRTLRIPLVLAKAGAAVLEVLRSFSSAPTLHTRDTVTSYNLNLDVEPGLPWKALGLEPEFPTIREGIPAALDDCVAFRWRHPVEDRAHW